MAAIGLKLIAISIAINNREFRHESLTSREYWFNTYDYIVVGAGTAGCVVAARLADDITKTVVLLEAGGSQKTSTDIPALRPSLVGTDIDWNYDLVPQKYAYFARRDGQINFPAGRLYGGTSAISRLNYYRESLEYFDLWNTAYGISNWAYEDVIPFFLKAENNLDTNLRDSTHKSQATGPLVVSTPNPDIILRKYLMSAERLGFNETQPDGRQAYGVSVMQRTINKDGVALSTCSAYLESKLRPNLNTFGNTFVTKILIDDKNHAIGVKFQKEGSFWTIKARKEVIISAGVIGSPQLLMLSGIGPSEHLNELAIQAVSDLRVGTNLKHSVAIELNYDIKDQKLIEKPIMNTLSEYEYYTEHTGPLAYAATAVQCFPEMRDESTGLSNGCVLPHVDYIEDKTDKYIEKMHLKEEWDEYYRPYLGHSVFKLKAILRRPKSTGYLRLESNNAFVRPLIDPKVFSVQSDVDEMVDTLKESLNVYNSELMADYIEPFDNPLPGCQPCTEDRLCDAYLRCVASTVTQHLYLVGTCRMGSLSDPDTVIDERFRVRGVTGLRVIDASVLPVPTENTLMLVVMLAERGVTFMVEENKNIFKSPVIKFNITQFINNIKQ